VEDAVLVNVACHAAEGREGEHGDSHVDDTQAVLYVKVIFLKLEPQRACARSKHTAPSVLSILPTSVGDGTLHTHDKAHRQLHQ
jgi:hypothetical protein